jgi:hypothetical protein
MCWDDNRNTSALPPFTARRATQLSVSAIQMNNSAFVMFALKDESPVDRPVATAGSKPYDFVPHHHIPRSQFLADLAPFDPRNSLQYFLRCLEPFLKKGYLF